MGKQYLPAIDGVRAFAVLAVVAYHAGLPLHAGFVGVDVFFVISGFVITRMLAAQPRIDLIAFYARRVRRILPAMLLVIVATVGLSAVFLPGASQLAVNRSATAALAMVANFHFQAVTGGYFDAGAERMPLLHLWSLAVEEQFYFVWPLLLLLRRRWLLVAIAIASFAFAQYFVWVNPEAAFFQMPARLWELAAGGLLAMSRPSRHGRIAGIVGLGVLCVAVAMPLPQFPGIGAVPAVVGALLVLHAIHSGARVAPFEWKPVRWIGLVSYSFYLWHWPLLAIARASDPSLATRVGLCVLALALAALTYLFVETPFRRGVARAKVIATGIVACALLAGCTSMMDTMLRRAGSLSVRIALDKPVDGPCTGFEAKCDADVVLWGDSHARHWRPFADHYGVVHQLTMDNCMPTALYTRGGSCAAFNKRALAVARRAGTVVVGGFWLEDLGPSGRADDFRSLVAALPNQHVVIIGPLPVMPDWPEHCIAAGDIGRCHVSRTEFERRAAPVRAFMHAEIARHPNIEYIEPAEFFCTATDCPMTKDGNPLYYDDDHITVSAARAFRVRVFRQ